MPSHITSSKLNANETALCGGLAGIVTRFAISPLDVIKIRLQLQSQLVSTRSLFTKGNEKYSGVLHSCKTIIQEEGFRGLYKGNVAAGYLYLTYGMSQFYAYYHMNTFMENHVSMAPSLKPFISGMVAGSFSTAVTYPFDLLRTRFAIQGEKKVYNSMVHAVRDIYGKEGLKGFYRGLGSSIVQIMPYMGLMFFTYEGLCTTIQKLKVGKEDTDRLDKTDDMICGSLSGIISKAGIFPLDVIRKRLQVQGPYVSQYIVSSIPVYSKQSSVISLIKSIVKTEGFWSLYKGITPSLLKAGPSGAVYFLAFEVSKDLMSNLKDKNYYLDTSILST
ncbi:mitochondrial carrier domain-containing protein [Sporodiniella umbellata]|nr:mitochondrial carrier domain-containing protein [Sporodiniella umbellata]